MIRVVDALTDPAWADEQAATTAANLRQADREEIAASSGLPPLGCIREGLRLSSHAWIVQDDAGAPICIFGAAPSAQADVGIVWLLGTDGIADEAFAIARATLRYLAALHATYPYLFNFVDARNTVSLRWLQWAGFDVIGEREAFGAGNIKFYEVVRRAPAALEEAA